MNQRGGMNELIGWMLDVYADPRDGLALWLLVDDDGAGPQRRCRLRQNFPIEFYAAGPALRLRALWRYLRQQPLPVNLARSERRDLFQPEPLTVLAVEVLNPAHQPRLFAQTARAFPDLTFYDADIGLSLRHAAAYGTFPLARLRVVADEAGAIHSLETLDSRWDLDPSPPPLGVMTLEPDCDPRHAPPTALHIRFERWDYRLSLQPIRPLLINLAAILRRHDPDLLLTAWGDTWLLPWLLERSQESGLPLPLNRDADHAVVRKAERTYFTYGQIVHRGGQVQLVGRWHIDTCNAVMFHDYGLEGVLESARLTALSVQDAARLSPGTGISSMQIITALRQGVLVPWHKQQVERSKTALDFLHADQGGLVYQPTIGLHRDVAEIDFISMYPSIMARFNLSPETIAAADPEDNSRSVRFEQVPDLNLWVDHQTPGLVPQTLEPLLQKRIALKERIATLPAWHPRRATYKARASAQKWLLVTCFGYLGYKNARFGRIEAHQAVTAYSRECLLRAKEAAEEAGCTVLHMYVDGLWVQKSGWASVADFQPLLVEIAERTHLPVALDGIYRWVAFLPSRTDARVPVANRYFGIFQTNAGQSSSEEAFKVRGIEARRHDTPPFIAQVQLDILRLLASVSDVDDLRQSLPQITAFIRRQSRTLRSRAVPLAQLLVTQKLSRELERYRAPSPAARAAAQLEQAGKPVRPGQYVRFLYTLGEPGVYAWDLPEPPLPETINVPRYTTLLMRAAETVLQPLGMAESPQAILLPTPAPHRL